MNSSNPNQPGDLQNLRGRRYALIAVLVLLTGLLTLGSLHSCAGETDNAQDSAKPNANPFVAPVVMPDHPGGGLVPPGPAAQKEEQKIPVVNQVEMNDLALQRLNAERKAKGLPPISAPTVAPGDEVKSSIPSTNAPESKP